MAEDRTQPATPRRREQAVRDGNLLTARELPGAVAVLAAAAVAAGLGGGFWRGMAGLLAHGLEAADGLPALLTRLPLGLPLTLVAIVALGNGVVGQLVTRHVALNLLTPKWNRISPVAGFRRIASPATAATALFAVLKLAAVALTGWVVLTPLLPALASVQPGGLALLGSAAVRLLLALALLLLVIAVAEAGFSWWRREQGLKMTLDEVKRESRENDGAPELKAAVRRAQMAAAQRRLQSAMAGSAVVVVNPIHFAVAMRYRPGQDQAPVVVEKGRLDMAHAIIAAARELGVPVIRSPRLARALFYTARRGETVREELFTAVATVLAFVMSFADAAERDPPPVEVPPALDFDETGAPRKPGAPLPL